MSDKVEMAGLRFSEDGAHLQWPRTYYLLCREIVHANWRMRSQVDRRAIEAKAEIRAMAERARRSVAQKVRWMKERRGNK